MNSSSCATTATAPGWPTISRTASSPSSYRKRSLRTLAVLPLQISSPPIRSNAIDQVSKHAAPCQGGPEEQLVLVRSAAHGTNGEAGLAVAVEVRRAGPVVVLAGHLDPFRDGDDRGPQQKPEHRR